MQTRKPGHAAPACTLAERQRAQASCRFGRVHAWHGSLAELLRACRQAHTLAHAPGVPPAAQRAHARQKRGRASSAHMARSESAACLAFGWESFSGWTCEFSCGWWSLQGFPPAEKSKITLPELSLLKMLDLAREERMRTHSAIVLRGILYPLPKGRGYIFPVSTIARMHAQSAIFVNMLIFLEKG